VILIKGRLKAAVGQILEVACIESWPIHFLFKFREVISSLLLGRLLISKQYRMDLIIKQLLIIEINDNFTEFFFIFDLVLP